MTAPRPASRIPRIALLLAVIAGAALPLDLVLHARSVTGAIGFPLDAAWIHLTFARTLAEHGVFRHFPGDTAGATPTAPLLMLIEAVLFRVVRNEKALALGLGILCHAAFLAVFASWARRRLESAAWAAAAVILVALDTRLAILAASGMETSLFLLAVALAFHERLAGRSRNAALALGASVWVRPDGLILAGVLVADALLPAGRAPARKRSDAPPGPRPAVRPSLAIFAACLAVYFAYQWIVGHSLLPDTFAARTALYQHANRMGFLTGDVWSAFLTVGSVPLLPLVLLALGREAALLVRRRPGAVRPEAAWTVALVLAYLLLLPAGGEFRRYLMPAVPAATIAALVALRAWMAHPRVTRLVRLADPDRIPGGRRALPLVGAAAAVALAAVAIPKTAREYAAAVGDVRQRGERTGIWLAENTPPAAVVAAHDLGAIGFYSRRRIVDTGGFLEREILPVVGTPNYPRALEQLFARRGVTHVAAMEEWLPVDNVPPLFEAGDPPRTVRVFPWLPGRSHIVLGGAWNQAVFASRAIAGGDYPTAIGTLDRAIRMDPRSARLWFLLGVALGNGDRPDEAERAFRRALQLFPGWLEAQDGLATSLESQGRPYDVPEALGMVPAPDTTRARAAPAARRGAGGR